MSFGESIVEDAALSWLGELDYVVAHGPEIAPGDNRSVSDPDRLAITSGLKSSSPKKLRRFIVSSRPSPRLTGSVPLEIRE